MLKPLLQTSPKLSGNVKLACTLSDYDYDKANNCYTCYVRGARLLPLSSNIYQKDIQVSLLSSSYEVDLKKYYIYYKDYFYGTTFKFLIDDFAKIDYTHEQKNRDIDFEYGCNRISYEQNGNEFDFYAPIYIESIDDMPDYFMIDVTLETKRYKTVKHIKACVKYNEEDIHNHLSRYIGRYLNKIDDNVLYFLPNTTQVTYYGIDLKHGGFVKKKDDVVNKLYHNQYTINNFDALLTNGFKRNTMAIRQILPLSFQFSIQNMLSRTEKRRYENGYMKISGRWYKDGMPIDFYNIDTNYNSLKQHVLKQSSSSSAANGMAWVSTDNNIMDMPFPSLNERRYINYELSNKITPTYNRWKLKYSDDSHPYITNMSPAFSMNQGSTYKYGCFPNKHKPMTAVLSTHMAKNGDEYTIKNILTYPTAKNITSTQSPWLGNNAAQTNYMNTINNYITTWFTTISTEDSIADIFDMADEWTDVHDGKAYHKGILYDLNKIYANMDSNVAFNGVDKFGVFVNVHFDILDKESLSTIRTARNVIQYDGKLRNTRINDKQGSDAETTDLYDREALAGISEGNYLLNAYYESDKSFKEATEEDSTGENELYINLADASKTYADINTYYKVNEILHEAKAGTSINIADINTANMIQAYEILPMEKFNEMIRFNERTGKHEFIIQKKTQSIYGDGTISVDMKENSWIYDVMYISENGTTKIPCKNNDALIDTLVQKLKNDEERHNASIYIKTNFISANDISDELKAILPQDIAEYEYCPMLSYNGTPYAEGVMKERMTHRSRKQNAIYVDPHNLGFLGVDLSNTYEFFAKIYNNVMLNIYINRGSTYDNLYIKRHVLVNVDDDVKHKYIKSCAAYEKVSEISEILPDYATFTKYTTYKHDAYEQYGVWKFNAERIANDGLTMPAGFDADTEFELYFLGDFAILDENIYEAMNMHEDQMDEYNDIYLYRNTNASDVMPDTTIFFERELPDKDTMRAVYDSLVPYFSSAYKQSLNDTIVYSDVKRELIRKNDDNGDSYYAYDNDYIDCMISANYLDAVGIDSADYTKYVKNDMQVNMLTNDPEYDDADLYKAGHLNSFVKDDTTYGFYLIDMTINNTSSCFNLCNELGYPVSYINQINDIDITNDDGAEYMLEQLPYYMPFLKIRLFDAFFKNANTIIEPALHTIECHYRQERRRDGMVNIKFHEKLLKKLQLQRYFDAVVPYIIKTNELQDAYCLQYKSYDASVSINEDNPLLYRNNININDYNENIVHVEYDDLRRCTPTEYKHLNASTFINLPICITIDKNIKCTYEQLHEYEEQDKVLEYFTEYMHENKYAKQFTDNDILFLFNRYTVKFDTQSVGLTEDKTQKLYTLIYKFILL